MEKAMRSVHLLPVHQQKGRGFHEKAPAEDRREECLNTPMCHCRQLREGRRSWNCEETAWWEGCPLPSSALPFSLDYAHSHVSSDRVKKNKSLMAAAAAAPDFLAGCCCWRAASVPVLWLSPCCVWMTFYLPGSFCL